jgi:CheY-like chemotaxis protein
VRTVPFLALALCLGGLASSAAQDPPGAVPRPQAIFNQVRQLVSEGKYDIAANFLQAFLESNPTDADFLEIEKKHGTTAFTGLRAIPRWSDDAKTEKQARANVEEAVKRSRAATEKLLHDPARVQKYVNNLGATFEERVFAEIELRRTGEYAIPYLVETFRRLRDANVDERNLRDGILGAIPKLEAHTMAGWVAALDGFTPTQQYGVLRALASRPDILALQTAAQTDLTPYLWRIMAQPADTNPTLRQFAEGLLNKLHPGLKAASRVPEAELVAQARTFYNHTARFAGTKTNPDGSPGTVPLWVWDTKVPETPKLVKFDDVPIGQAEEYYGLRYARWALQKKPDYEPAQSLILSLAAERAVERARFGSLAKAEPAVFKLLSDAPASVLGDMLARGLNRKRTALVVASLQALGERGDKDTTSLMVKALDYADPQVQIAAANALLRSPVPIPAEVKAKIVTILRRAAAADAPALPDMKGTALVTDPNRLRGDDVAALLRGLGYNVEVFTTGRDLLRRVARASDFDVIFIDRHTPNPELIDTVGQLLGDVKSGGRPTFVIASTDTPRVPTFDQLVIRFAALIAATENEIVPMPDPYVPPAPPRMVSEEEIAAARKQIGERRDGVFRSTAAQRIARLKRVIDTTGLTLSATQKRIFDLRVELITYAVLGAEFPISPESSPGTVLHLARLRKQIDAQPATPAYGAGTPTTDMLKLMERFEIDLARVPTAQKRFETIYSRVDPVELGLPVETFRDLALEAQLMKTLRGYPTVRIIPEPAVRATLAADLEAAQADPAKAPRDPAEKIAARKLAIDWLRKMATDELPGFDVKSAEPELRAALRSDDPEVAAAAIDGVSRYGSADAQLGLLTLAMNIAKPPALRTKAADAAIRHVQVHGKSVPKSLTDTLGDLSKAETDAALRGKLVTLSGMFTNDAGAFAEQLTGYNPPLLPPPPPKDPPKDPKDPDPKMGN